MLAKQYFIYLFRVKKTGKVIYVGSTKAIGKRLNEHRRGMREQSHRMPIHDFMKENNLKLFEDVEVSIVDFFTNATKDEVLKKEAEYYYKYKETLKNTRPAEIRNDEFSPRSKPIKCLNDGKIFVSIRKAAEEYGLNRATISKHLNKGSILKNGLVFEYIKPEDKVARNLYKIRCIEDDAYFSTFKSCASAYGMTESQIYNRMRNSNDFVFCGKHFERCNDYQNKEN